MPKDMKSKFQVRKGIGEFTILMRLGDSKLTGCLLKFILIFMQISVTIRLSLSLSFCMGSVASYLSTL